MRALSTKTSKQKPKPKTTTRKRRNRQRNAAKQQALGLSPCAANYLKAICDPFGAILRGQEVCIPDILDMPSYKFSTLFRGTGVVQANGLALIETNPFCIDQQGAYVAVTKTGAAVTQFQTANFGSATWDVYGNPQFPFSTAAGRRACRVVACGLRARYTGTQLNMGGLIVPCSALSVSDTLFGLDFTSISGRQDVKRYNYDRAWRGCTFRPMYPAAYEYIDSSYDVNNDRARMGIIIMGTAGQSFEFEIAHLFEAIPDGTHTVPGTTKSHSDLQGLSVVRDVLGQVSSSEVGQGLLDKAQKYLKNSLKESLSAVHPALGLGANLLTWEL